MTKREVLAALATAFALLATVLALGIWLLSQSPLPEESGEEARSELTVSQPEPLAGTPPPARRIRVTLYFLSDSGIALWAEDREIAFSNSLQEQAKQVVRELLAGSRSGLVSPFPEGVELRDLFVTPQGLVFVDFSQELVSKHPGGARGEQLTVFSLANTLTTNFPAVKKVQILVEGQQVESLAGHLDLSIPYGRNPQAIERSGGQGQGP